MYEILLGTWRSWTLILSKHKNEDIGMDLLKSSNFVICKLFLSRRSTIEWVKWQEMQASYCNTMMPLRTQQKCLSVVEIIFWPIHSPDLNSLNFSDDTSQSPVNFCYSNRVGMKSFMNCLWASMLKEFPCKIWKSFRPHLSVVLSTVGEHSD